MDLTGKVETDVHLKISAAQFHEMFADKLQHISIASGSNIQSCDLHEGDWGTVGTVIGVNYVHDGKQCYAKEIIEEIDPEKNSGTFKVIEGDLMEHFKTFRFRFQAIPKDDEGCTVRWTLEYEKLHGDITDPHTLLHVCVDVLKDIDTHVTSQA